jgi:hypothetical protein
MHATIADHDLAHELAVVAWNDRATLYVLDEIARVSGATLHALPKLGTTQKLFGIRDTTVGGDGVAHVVSKSRHLGLDISGLAVKVCSTIVNQNRQ